MASGRGETTGWRGLLGEGRLPRLALILLGVWLNAADTLVTATIMPSVGAELGGYAYFGWAVAGFLVGGILAGASAGRFAEILGLRAATTVSGVVFALGCVASAVAPNMGAFLAGRLLQGLGSGWISGFAMVGVAFLFPERHLARVFAAVSGIWGIATILGPLIGGVFAGAGAWRAVFWWFAAQAVLFAAASPWLLRGTTRTRQASGVPWLQLATLGVGVLGIALADLTRSPAVAVAMVAAGLGVLALVLRIDRRARVRLLPHRAGDLRTETGTAYAAMFGLAAGTMGIPVYGPALLQELHGLSPLWAGYTIALESLAWTMAAFAVAGVPAADEGRWIRRGAGAIVAGEALLAAVMPGPSVAGVGLALILVGLGFGLVTAPMNRRVIGLLSDEDKATGSAALIAVRQTGGAVGAAIAGATANLVGFGAGPSGPSATAAAVWVFATALPLAAGGAWAAHRLTRMPRRPAGAAAPEW